MAGKAFRIAGTTLNRATRIELLRRSSTVPLPRTSMA